MKLDVAMRIHSHEVGHRLDGLCGEKLYLPDTSCRSGESLVEGG